VLLSDGDEGLSSGAIMGMAVGCSVAVIIIIVVIIVCIYRHNAVEKDAIVGVLL
jgi:uncharacterized membrane protein (Fun14 family)